MPNAGNTPPARKPYGSAAEELHDFVGFIGAHQAGVDEHAGELVADGFVDQNGSDG